MNQTEPIIGQECICPHGVGRVAAVTTSYCGGRTTYQIKVDTYIGNHGCVWDANNVELIDPHGMKCWKKPQNAS